MAQFQVNRQVEVRKSGDNGAEYQKRKGEFDSYADFINKKLEENDWSRRFWNKTGGKENGAEIGKDS